MDSVRLFAALLFPDDLLAGVAAFQYSASRFIPESLVKWIPRDNLHLTLQFLGDTPRDRINRVVEAMDRAVDTHRAHGTGPVSIVTSGAGAFPGLSRPRVIWLGLDGDTPILSDLNLALRHELSEIDVSYDEKPFRPHLTIAYVRKGHSNAELRLIGEALGRIEAPRCVSVVESIHLVASDLRPDGAHYSTVATVPLA